MAYSRELRSIGCIWDISDLDQYQLSEIVALLVSRCSGTFLTAVCGAYIGTYATFCSTREPNLLTGTCFVSDSFTSSVFGIEFISIG
jgi:hypothetical protein